MKRAEKAAAYTLSLLVVLLASIAVIWGSFGIFLLLFAVLVVMLLLGIMVPVFLVLVEAYKAHFNKRKDP